MRLEPHGEVVIALDTEPGTWCPLGGRGQIADPG